MPIPNEHVEQLRELTDAVTTLAKFSRRDERKILLSLDDLARTLRDPYLKTTLDHFHDNPRAREEAAEDATAYFRNRGVRLPEGMIVTIVPSNFRVSVCVKVVIFGVGVEYGYHYDSNEGFGWGC